MFKVLGDVDRWTIFSMKLATMAFVLIVLKTWGGAMNWVNNTNVWWFVLAFVIFAIRAGMGAGCCRDKSAKKNIAKRKIKKPKK